MQQYLALCQHIIDQGVWVENKRTGKKCLTVVNADFSYDVANNQFPIITTRKSFWKAAIAELLGTYVDMIMLPTSVNWELNRGMLMRIRMNTG